MAQYGPKWPLKKGSEDLYEMYTDIKDQINFYIKNLLLTSKGENLSDPSYGVGIRSFLFEQNIESVRGAIEAEIQQQFAVYLPYVDIEDILVDASSGDIDSNSLSVKVSYRLPGQSVPNIFELESETAPVIGFY